jgi:hypothetical protein
MREWRQTHPLSEEERRKDICRSYTHMLVKRGHIQKSPCLLCLAEPAQAHHPDYNDPRLVFWLCLEHHREEHEALDARERGWGWETPRSMWLSLICETTAGS